MAARRCQKALVFVYIISDSVASRKTAQTKFNQVFAESVVSGIDSLISVPRTRVLNLLVDSFGSGENYVIDANNEVDFETLQSFYWNLKLALDGDQAPNWIYAGFEDSLFVGYADPLSYAKAGAALLHQEAGVDILSYYWNTTHPITGKIDGPPGSNHSYDCTGRPWYVKSKQYGSVWSDPYAFIDDGALGITAATPMITSSGVELGAFGVDYRLVVIDEYLNSLVINSRFTIFIVESSGLMIASSVPGAAVDGVNQVRANTSDVSIIKEIGLKIQTEFENNWTRADGVVLTVNTESDGVFFARSYELADGYGLLWHVVVAESVSCDVGFYISAGDGVLDNDESVCDGCLHGAECVGGDYLPYPKRGYWMDLDSKKIKGSIYSCSWETCLGFDQKVKLDYDNMYATLLDLCWSTTSDRQNSSLCDYDDLMCMEGSTGPMCGSCKENWRYNPGSQSCEMCNQVFWLKSLSVALFLLIVGAIGWMSANSRSLCPPRFQHEYLCRGYVKVITFITQFDRGALKLLWSTYQIVQSISFSINITFPDLFVVSFWSCCGLLVLVFLARVWYNEVQFDLRDRHLKALLAHHCHISLLIIYVVVPPVTNQQFKALACQEISDDQSYLRVDTSVDCNSDYYRRFVLVDALMIAAYQALSLLYITLLCRVRHKLNPIAPNKVLALHIRDNDESLQPIRVSVVVERFDNHSCLSLFFFSVLFAKQFLFADYKINYWYFEITDLYRRIMFISILPLVSQRSLTKAYFGCILSLFSTVYFREAMPYRVEFTNFIGVIAQYVILLDFMAALMLDSLSVPDARSPKYTFLGLLLIGVNLIIVMMAFFLTWHRYHIALQTMDQGKEKELKIEWAVEFSSNKFQTTLQYVIERGVPSSHILCYYYTSLAQARESLKLNMIPATVEEDGIMVSLKGPMEIAEGDLSLELMGERAHSYEAVLCLDLPKHALFKVASRPGLKRQMRLRHVPRDLLFSLGVFVPPERKRKVTPKFSMLNSFDSVVTASSTPTSTPKSVASNLNSMLHQFGRVQSSDDGDAGGGENGTKQTDGSIKPKPEWSHILKLDLSCALRAYQLKHEENCKSSTISWSSSIIKPSLLRDPTLMDVAQPETISEYLDEMKSIRQECSEEGTIPLYHYTSIQVARSIFDHGFRMSTQGQGDGGVYFSTLGPASYGIDRVEYEDNIIVDCFGEERLEEYRGKGQLDVCFVYGVNPKLIEPAPGGRYNAVMVSKDLFETFGVLSYGCYYLRPDYIKGAFSFESLSRSNVGLEDKEDINSERSFDNRNQQVIRKVTKRLKPSTIGDNPNTRIDDGNPISLNSVIDEDIHRNSFIGKALRHRAIYSL